MSRITMQRFVELQEMGREPINLPAEIFFGGNEVAQKTPGRHHLPKYRETGTYNLPQLKAQRKRVAMDRAKRLLNGKMSEVELRKVGGIAGINKALEEFKLKIDESQMEIAEMYAASLEAEGAMHRKQREEAKVAEAKAAGKEYTPAEADAEPSVDVARAIARANSVKLKPIDDLSSLKAEEEKDGNMGEDQEFSGDAPVDDTVDVEVRFDEI